MRHARGAEFKNAVAAAEPFLEGLSRHCEQCQAVGDDFIDVTVAEVAAFGAAAQDLVQRNADPAEFGRQVEQLTELPVPADQAVATIEHGDAVADLGKGGLEQIAVVLQGLRGVVEQLQRGLAADVTTAQHQGQHETRRGRADRTAEQVFGVAHSVNIGLGARVVRHIAAREELCKGARGACRSEIARHRGLQVRHRDRASPIPECRLLR